MTDDAQLVSLDDAAMAREVRAALDGGDRRPAEASTALAGATTRVERRRRRRTTASVVLVAAAAAVVVGVIGFWGGAPGGRATKGSPAASASVTAAPLDLETAEREDQAAQQVLLADRQVDRVVPGAHTLLMRGKYQPAAPQFPPGGECDEDDTATLVPVPLTDVETQWIAPATTTSVQTATGHGLSARIMAREELIHFPSDAGARAYTAALRRAVTTCNHAHPEMDPLRVVEASNQAPGTLVTTQDPATVEAFVISGATAVRLFVSVPHPGSRADAAALRLATEAVAQARERMRW